MKILTILFMLLLVGCSSNQSGVAEYELEPVTDDNGNTVCCKVTVHNSKDYEGISFKMVKKKDGSLQVELEEIGVSASDPAAIAAQNNAKLLEVLGRMVPPVVEKVTK